MLLTLRVRVSFVTRFFIPLQTAHYVAYLDVVSRIVYSTKVVEAISHTSVAPFQYFSKLYTIIQNFHLEYSLS